DEDDAEQLVVADDLTERPARLPALFAVLDCGLAVFAGVAFAGLGETASQFGQKAGKIVQQRLVVQPARVGLLLDRLDAPALDEQSGVLLKELADLGKVFRP